MEQKRDDSLASGKISSLLVKFAVPSIIAMVVGALLPILLFQNFSFKVTK